MFFTRRHVKNFETMLAIRFVVVVVVAFVCVTSTPAAADALPMQFGGESLPLASLIAIQLARPQGNGPDGKIDWEGHIVPQDGDDGDKRRRTSPKNTSSTFTQTQHKRSSTATLTAGPNFEGPGTGIPGYVVNSAPPDTTMGVGPNHIVAYVNTHFMIFNKTGGILVGRTNGNALFSGLGNECETTNRGDPLVQYDKLADRWIISQFAFGVSGGVPVAPFLQCIAVSTTGNPTSTYFRYSTSFVDFNDYGKLSVWPNGYYFSFVMFRASDFAYLGSKLCVAERAQMLVGAPAQFLCTPTGDPNGVGGVYLPADLDGTTLPSDTTRGLFVGWNFFTNLALMYPPRTDSEHGIKKTAFKPADFCFYTLHTHPS